MLSRGRGEGIGTGGLWQFGGLVLLVALVAGALAGVGSPGEDPVMVEILPGPGKAPEATTIRFELPPAVAEAPPWVVWLPRDARQVVWIEARGWRSRELNFYRPDPAEGVLPAGYRFELPRRWEGPVTATVHAWPANGATPEPRVMRLPQAARLQQAGAAGSAAVYGGLLMLAMMSLSLYAAARDRVFLTLAACTAALTATLASVNGHLYSVPGLALLAHLQSAGLWALVFVFLATWVRLIQQYVGVEHPGPWVDRVGDGLFWVLLGAAALCLVGVGLGLPGWLWHQVSVAAWVLVGTGSFIVLAAAGRRRVAMAWPLAGLLLATLVVAVLQEFQPVDGRLDPLLARLLYQLGLVMFLMLTAIGLVQRISEYREQRDRDRLARADTERRMLREAARTDLVNTLQSRLRQVGQEEVAWTGFRVMADHLLPLLPVELLVVVAEGFHGSELLLVDPPAMKDEASMELRGQCLALKRQAANGIALQHPVPRAGSASTQAVVPLKLRPPSWGALLLWRRGSAGFSPDEMALANEFCRIAQMHVEQAVAAIKLRQSAELDALTGSLNRRSIDQWLSRCFLEAERDGQPLSVLFVDLDRFKAINDRHGHACGDQCLRVVAATLSGALGERDLVGRYGGEEFIAILPGRGGAAARQVGERLRAAVERHAVDWEGQPVRLTVSVGVATRRDGESTPEATIDRADKALYASKRAGRNCVHVAPAVFT